MKKNRQCFSSSLLLLLLNWTYGTRSPLCVSGCTARPSVSFWACPRPGSCAHHPTRQSLASWTTWPDLGSSQTVVAWWGHLLPWFVSASPWQPFPSPIHSSCHSRYSSQAVESLVPLPPIWSCTLIHLRNMTRASEPVPCCLCYPGSRLLTSVLWCFQWHGQGIWPWPWEFIYPIWNAMTLFRPYLIWSSP